MRFKQGIGNTGQGFDPLHVIVRGEHGNVTHVSSQKGQFCLNIDTAMVPAQENVHGEAETEVVDARQSAVRLSDSSKVEGNVQVLPKLSTTVCLSAPTRIQDQWSIVRQMRANRPVFFQECFEFHNHITRQGQDAGFVKLRDVNRERLLQGIVIGSGQTKQLPSADTGGVEENDGQAGCCCPKRRSV